MTRSRSPTCTGLTAGSAANFFAAADLATVTPCDDETEDHVQPAESHRHEQIPRLGNHGGCNSEKHVEQSHHGNDSNGMRAARDERRSVQKQPERRHREVLFRAPEDEGQNRAGDERREIARKKTACRRGGEIDSGALALDRHRDDRDGGSDQSFDQPAAEPRLARSIAHGDSGANRRDSDREPAPSRNRGERPGALHRFPAVAQVVERMITNTDGLGHWRLFYASTATAPRRDRRTTTSPSRWSPARSDSLHRSSPVRGPLASTRRRRTRTAPPPRGSQASSASRATSTTFRRMSPLRFRSRHSRPWCRGTATPYAHRRPSRE